MSIKKSLIGLEEKHSRLLEGMVSKKDKRFKNKSAVVRTILDLFCTDNKKDGPVVGVIILRKNNCSAFDFTQKSSTTELLNDSHTIEIIAKKDKELAKKGVSVNIKIEQSECHRF